MTTSAHFRKTLIYHLPSICFLMLFVVFSGCKRKPGNTANNQTDPRLAALMYMSQNHLDEAEAAFQKAIEVNPDEILNYIDLVKLYILQKNYDKAAEEARTGLKVKPGNADLELILAEALEGKQDRQGAINEIQGVLKTDPKNVKALYQLSGLGPAGSDATWKKPYLLKVLNLLPANIVTRLQLAEIFAGNNQADSARYFLEGVKKISPQFPSSANEFYSHALSLLQAGQGPQALPYIRQFHQLMKITPLYDSDHDAVEFPKMVAGSPGIIVNDDEQITEADSRNFKSVTFADVDHVGLPFDKGLNATNSVLAVADREANGNLYVYASFVKPDGERQYKLWVSKIGGFESCSVSGGIEHEGHDLAAAFTDYDNDGYQDLFVATDKGTIIYKNQGDGTFAKLTDNAGLGNTGQARQLLFADFDQDGDLDMYVAEKGTNKFYRNNGDGTFTENAAAMGLTANPGGTEYMRFGDWDSDGDLDIVMLNETGHLQLLNNDRHSHFSDMTGPAGLQNPAFSGSALALGDYNNDGLLDIFVAGGENGKCSLLKNSGQKFTVDPASATLSNSLKGIDVKDAAFIDFDNDGHQDLLIAGINKDNSKRGIKLFHNDTTKGFSDVSFLLPKSATQAYCARTGDFDQDGDEDIFLSGPSGTQLLRNDGGSNNHNIQVQLQGLAYGNSKNNRLGIGAQVELKVGDLYQMKTVTGPVTEFGMGARSKPDAIRIIWPNGTPQTIVDPSKTNRILELEKLKGSCPFLFTWNGRKYEFVKDMLWRSALGMPVAINGKDTAYSFSDASKEYLLIPGDKLAPRDGKYSLKITEELWEAVYVDKAGLTAVDHPDSVNVFADERFVPPPFPGKKVYRVSKEHLPVSATDGRGTNLLPQLSRYDFQYASNFTLGKYQGLAAEHDLILNLGPEARADDLYLFLRGWVFPGDASINTAETQSDKYQQHPPELQVIDAKGQWKTVIPNIGFPMGRDKMVVVNLSGKFLSKTDRRVRIRTNMQIYWDHVFFANGQTKAPMRMTDLTMADAALNFRGYSTTYRKGGPYGPEWFDYDNPSTGQKWRDLTGYYTRYGDVLPLLQKADDEYIICDGGDEVSIDFDAGNLPALPKGWKRDFLIYSEGWVKDGDLNTANGQTVEPLPFHAMPSYPYGKKIVYPNDQEHRAYRQKYNTRKVTTEEFRNALKPKQRSGISKPQS
ncbi:MAG TPA: FG-GAP-like repeat-containing protein [Mucilaginibacter sp.]|nr:FG-GAP-like repeat-containing protein [Mucilaginibacter sp.]